jgi:hypothetical protein
MKPGMIKLVPIVDVDEGLLENLRPSLDEILGEKIDFESLPTI